MSERAIVRYLYADGAMNVRVLGTDSRFAEQHEPLIGSFATRYCDRVEHACRALGIRRMVCADGRFEYASGVGRAL